MDQGEIPALLSRLASDEDAVRKMAVFKLQTSINDPSFADMFISTGGLIILRRLIMSTSGNTLAYALQSLARLLEVDMGWGIFEGPTAGQFVECLVELIVKNPLVNILRGCMSILVSLVGHSHAEVRSPLGSPAYFGFRALRPAIAVYPQFLELVVQQLHSADHSLCSNALMLANALIRDSLANEFGPKPHGSAEWPRFVRKLQDLGLVRATFKLMQSSALQDLALPLMEFQALSKHMMLKWKEVPVDIERPEQRRALKGLHFASRTSTDHASTNGNSADGKSEGGKKSTRRHSPEKWRRLGFETESPAAEFSSTGFLGLMDLAEYVRTNEDGFQKMLLEQSTKPMSTRCPIARASLAVTLILYDHFDCDNVEVEDMRGYRASDGNLQDKYFRPLLLQWSRMHQAVLRAFFGLWKDTCAEQHDFDKVSELVRILVKVVLGSAGRCSDVADVEEEILQYPLARLREQQMELLAQEFEKSWGKHLHRARHDIRKESTAFIKEQRIRCLLEGSWFQKPSAVKDESQAVDKRNEPNASSPTRRDHGNTWRYAKLSPNRRYLHYRDFTPRCTNDPTVDMLTEKVDLSKVSSVISNVTMPQEDDVSESVGSRGMTKAGVPSKSTTKITILSYGKTGEEDGEIPVLVLHPSTQILASEWLDGLLMLLEQTPITAETNRLIDLVSDYGLKIRLLNVRLDTVRNGPMPGAGVVPSREGLDRDYYYEI